MTFKKLLFVCMGNSCSSPMAETIMQNLMVKTSLYWEVDSAALRQWNIGRRPHKNCLRVLREHGLRSDHFCRLLTIGDFYYYDIIVAMDEHVHKELLLWAGANHIANTSHVIRLSVYGKNGKPVTINNLSPGSKMKAFRCAYYRIKECCKQLLLAKEVRIVRYDMPSTDGSDDDTNSRQRNISHVDSSDSPGSANDDAPSCTPSKSPNASCSMCCIQAPNSNGKTLCQKCCQKFLAEL